MKKVINSQLSIVISLLSILVALSANAQTNLYGFTVKDDAGDEVSLADYRGKVLLIVNTATRCGFTPQYKELEALYQRYHDEGLEILDFPCNQFGDQAPGSIQEIHQFCTANFNIHFPQFDKIDVNGPSAAPLYTYLKSQKGFEGFDLTDKMGKLLDNMMRKRNRQYDKSADIKWNFTKFLVSADGYVLKRYEPTVKMNIIEEDLKQELCQRLARHDFFYAGQSKRMRMFIVKNGQVSWTYDNALRGDDERLRGEISDAVLLTDGHILMAHQYGVAELDGTGAILWRYAAPEGTEIHTVQPIGRSHVVFVQNGKPAKVVVMKIPSCRIVREFNLPTNENGSVHGQFRNARLTSRGTLLVANMSKGCIHEYNAAGQEVDRWTGFLPWSVQEMPKTGNLLITGRKGSIQEINRQGQVVWQLNTTGYGVTQPQKTVRLKNGHHLINNWYNEWNKQPMDTLHAPVQAIEVDQNGQVVWQLRAWQSPDLGPSTTIQLLTDAVKRERMFFGEFNGQQPKLFLGPNEPVGEGRGIHPGRVAWIHSPGVAKWDGKTGLWVEDRWNDQRKADAMIPEAVMQLTGEPTPKKAWKALFKNFNKTHGRGNRGYKKGEMIAVKLNLNNAITHHDTIELNSSPFMTLALVRSLVRDGGVREQDIVLCEPSRAITDSIYYKVYREFPLVRMVDNIGGDGRLKCEYYPEQIVYSVDNGKMARGLAKCIVDADYLINSALLKTHSGPGVTLTTKNWYGATDINLLWRQNAHNNVSQDKRNGKPQYKTFVDWMAHKHMGQKALLFLIDGTYGSRDVNGAPNPKWMKEPFNGDWACSLFVSQDEVACDAVAMDVIINEWPEFGSLNYCDEYLREAATIPTPPSGTVYKQDGQPLQQPLGLMEHWNRDHKYTKIDLKYKKL